MEGGRGGCSRRPKSLRWPVEGEVREARRPEPSLDLYLEGRSCGEVEGEV